MDLGKPLKTVTVPNEVPVRRPVEQPDRAGEEELIPLPENWPTRIPVKAPQQVERTA
jgi:hypothetical protein